MAGGLPRANSLSRICPRRMMQFADLPQTAPPPLQEKSCYGLTLMVVDWESGRGKPWATPAAATPPGVGPCANPSSLVSATKKGISQEGTKASLMRLLPAACGHCLLAHGNADCLRPGDSTGSELAGANAPHRAMSYPLRKREEISGSLPRISVVFWSCPLSSPSLHPCI